MISKEELYAFINKQQICVLSTVNSGNKPESAAMAFSVTEGLEIIFSVNFESRKLRNIELNNNVSIVFGWDMDDFITVQYEGVIERIENDLEKYQEIHFDKNPDSKKFKDLPGNTYLKVTPKWIRYSDLKNKIIEENKY
ncbi:MAG: pyridoxamine 5'-phosphate oxidase family protein [Candidatus Dojkabacteria bacterium]|nr:pyridoxamine 5'-phosphate oxidase family protein [Candidatus Dojkabacteria bacterium]MDQ7020670.1 pyridoxamine 5'-phosphate oxidase family protein [Candidatus Dojkabacteria bacterium]